MVPYLSQVHRIFDCDGFTREFLEGLGISVPQPEPLPEDGFSRTREKVQFQSYKFLGHKSSPSILHFDYLVNL